MPGAVADAVQSLGDGIGRRAVGSFQVTRINPSVTAGAKLTVTYEYIFIWDTIERMCTSHKVVHK